MHLDGFRLRDIYVERGSDVFDLHNNYYFVGFAFDNIGRSLVLRWTPGGSAAENERRSLVIAFSEVSHFSIEPRDPEIPFTEDDCLSFIGYARPDSPQGEALIGEIQPEMHLIFCFMSELRLRVYAETATLRVVEYIEESAIRYLNTDLDLASDQNLKSLADALSVTGLCCLHLECEPNGRCFARFETEQAYANPHENIEAFLNVLETLDESTKRLWWSCSLREFNIGFDCGDKPWASNAGLAPSVLARMAALGIGLRLTLYPPAMVGSSKRE